MQAFHVSGLLTRLAISAPSGAFGPDELSGVNPQTIPFALVRLVVGCKLTPDRDPQAGSREGGLPGGRQPGEPPGAGAEGPGSGAVI